MKSLADEIFRNSLCAVFAWRLCYKHMMLLSRRKYPYDAVAQNVKSLRDEVPIFLAFPLNSERAVFALPMPVLGHRAMLVISGYVLNNATVTTAAAYSGSRGSMQELDLAVIF